MRWPWSTGPAAGLDLLATLDRDDRIAQHHRVAAVRAHLLDLAGDLDAAEAGFVEAARSSTSIPERRYLEARAARLKGVPRPRSSRVNLEGPLTL